MLESWIEQKGTLLKESEKIQKKVLCPFVCLQTIESRKIFWSTTIKPIEVFLCQRIFSLAPFYLLLAPLPRLCRQRRSSSPWSSPSQSCHHHHHCNNHNRLWQVSWIRRRENEMSLLTTDRLVFSADNRYSVVQVLLVSLLLVVLLVLMLVLVLLLTTDQLVFSADKRYSVVQVPNNRPSVAKME